MSAEEATEQKSAETDATPAGEAAIVAAIGMSSLLVSFLTSLKSTVTEFFGDMKALLENVIVEDIQPTEEAKGKRRLAKDTDSSTKQPAVATAPQTVEKGQKSDSTEQSIVKLINQSSEPHREATEAGGEIDVLSGIANDLKVHHKKGPAVNQQIAKIGHGLMREKLSDDVLTETQNWYNRPENCECLTTTKGNHLIWDKLKPSLVYQHFRMDSLKSVTGLMTQGCYMASVDIRDAYYTPGGGGGGGTPKTIG